MYIIRIHLIWQRYSVTIQVWKISTLSSPPNNLARRASAINPKIRGFDFLSWHDFSFDFSLETSLEITGLRKCWLKKWTVATLNLALINSDPNETWIIVSRDHFTYCSATPCNIWNDHSKQWFILYIHHILNDNNEHKHWHIGNCLWRELISSLCSTLQAADSNRIMV